MNTKTLYLLLTLALFIDLSQGLGWWNYRYRYQRYHYRPSYYKCDSRAVMSHCTVGCRYKGCSKQCRGYALCYCLAPNYPSCRCC
ncbi:hypothetical protein LSAT2_015509 [Lamellibrachia satsuma]|nr:hypothetical protein LSAT2_015509 [Lamellibrachia satsuma]